MEFKLKYSYDTNVRDLPGKIMVKLRDALDSRCADGCSYWRKFAAGLSDRFIYTAQEVERLAQNIYNGHSPSQQLLLEVGARGMNVKELVTHLDRLHLEDILCDLVEHQKVKIVTQPEAFVKVHEGDQIAIGVEAVGFPYPRFLWHRPECSIPHATDPTFIINKARTIHNGQYCCLVYNNSAEGVYSEWCQVTVLPSERANFVLHMYPDETNTFYEGFSKPGTVYTLPVIIRQPQNVSVPDNMSFCLVCEARGHLPLTYKWHCNNRLISESQNGYYKVPKCSLKDDGIYQCVVQNQFGVVRSQCVTVGVNTSSCTEYLAQSLIPEILEHPKSCHVQLGGDAIFRCSAHGLPPLKYQWFKDCESIPGADENEYRVFSAKDRSVQGVYMCLVSNNTGQCLTKGAVLQISETLTHKQDYFATDKLALLIGNYDYRSQQPLTAPQSDIQNLSNIFQILGFKVVSLLNLTLTEMNSAVDEFCELIDQGVYCVFYFCGHGFEENNCCYILPNDVPVDYKTEECLSAQFVLRKMQKQRPKVCCMILDICRRPSDSPNPRVPLMDMVPDKTPVDGNTVVCYATSCGLAAYEVRTQSKGILVTHLEKFLPQPISIENVFSQVRAAVGNDTRVNENPRTRQIPEVRSNLIEVNRSFSDLIQTTGHTRACTKRQLAWENAHVKPQPQDVPLKPEDLGVVVRLTFQHEFSNVLSVFVKIIKHGILENCVAWIHKLPSSVSMMKKPVCVSEEGMANTVTKNVIIDIQKLNQENLSVGLAMKYRYPGSKPDDFKISPVTFVDLQLPLVANLQLWRARTPSHKRAVEQSEEVVTSST